MTTTKWCGFTFHNVSINSHSLTAAYHAIVHLHSIMYLLIQAATKNMLPM